MNWGIINFDGVNTPAKAIDIFCVGIVMRHTVVGLLVKRIGEESSTTYKRLGVFEIEPNRSWNIDPGKLFGQAPKQNSFNLANV
jgi:hypothetical protein